MSADGNTSVVDRESNTIDSDNRKSATKILYKQMVVCVAEPMDLSNVRYIFLEIYVKEIEMKACISRLESLIKIVEFNYKIVSSFFATILYKNGIKQEIQIVLYLELNKYEHF